MHHVKTFKAHKSLTPLANLNQLTPYEQLKAPEFIEIVRRRARSLLKNGTRQQVDDLSHTVLLKTLEALHENRYKDEGRPFMAYVFKILLNEFYNMRKIDQRFVDVGDFDRFLAKHELTSTDALNKPTQEDKGLALYPVLQAMKELSPKRQQALWAIADNGNFKDAAAELGIRRKVLVKRVWIARAALRKILKIGPMQRL